MPYEVEQKFQLSDEQEFTAFSCRMKEYLTAHYQGVVKPVIQEKDVYYNHPSRDFKSTDEAFRLRFQEGRGFITYKGPKLDTQTKTRRELELPLFDFPQESADDGWALLSRWGEMLEALGFVPVGAVFKIRQKIHFVWDNRFSVEMSLDQVAPVGFFVELELIAPSEKELDLMRSILLQIADALKLEKVVKRSYLDLVLNA